MIYIIYAPKFLRQLKKLRPDLIREVKRKIILFKNNPQEPTLRAHKLHGDLADCWAFSVNQSYRIIFKFFSEKEVGFLQIGDHDIYK